MSPLLAQSRHRQCTAHVCFRGQSGHRETAAGSRSCHVMLTARSTVQQGFSDDLARVDDDASLLVRDDMKIVRCMVSPLRLEIAARGPNAPCALADCVAYRHRIVRRRHDQSLHAV